jgi:MHS family proline/betaine transporter-like MFS transporter
MKKILISGMIGNALEWYDFILYAHFSFIFSKIFFPDNHLNDILTFAVFSIGFISRPLGGVLLSYIGDRYGRRLSLTISILTMALPTTAIGLLPSYEVIGIAAPIILILLRLLQGFSLGGEFSSCVTYFAEHSPPKIRGLIGSAVYVSQCLGMLLGLFVSTKLSNFLTTETLWSWGWRIPFISGIIIGGIGIYIRLHLSESPVYLEAKRKGYLSSSPFLEAIRGHWRKILLAIGLYINVTAQFYAVTVLIPNHMLTLGYLPHQSSITCCLVLFIMVIAFPIAAYFSDKIGRKKIMLGTCVALALMLLPSFYILTLMNFQITLITMTILAAIVAMHMSPAPAALSELFSTPIRLTGVALSSNLSAAIFGGTVPLVGAILQQYINSKISIAYYLSSLAIVGVFIILKYKENGRIFIS